jgi:hypothetical protein
MPLIFHGTPHSRFSPLVAQGGVLGFDGVESLLDRFG